MTETFTQFVQTGITPVALISGVGLLLLTFTNRLGRTIDRTRFLVEQLDGDAILGTDRRREQIRILYRRSALLRSSIGALVGGLIAACLIIPVLLVMLVFDWDLRVPGYVLFTLAIVLILVSLVFFLRDVALSLRALHLEAGDYLDD